MKIIPFTISRFTPDDLAEFGSVADLKLQRGQWAAVLRQSGPGFDRLTITLPGVDRPVFSFERDRRGAYRLRFNDRAGWYDIGSGDTAAECLSVWRTRSRQPATA